LAKLRFAPNRRRSESQSTVWPAGILHRDIRKGLGLPAESVAVWYSSHTIEHLFRDEALRLLQEAHRLLKPGGICRVVVPDLGSIVDWYLANRHGKAVSDWPSSELFMRLALLRPPSSQRRWGLRALYARFTDFDYHKWMYDAQGLLALFGEAGFVDAEEKQFLEGAIPQDSLARVELPSRVLEGAGICVEARK
jgi:predicted SAM-dependent methyltransferase